MFRVRPDCKGIILSGLSARLAIAGTELRSARDGPGDAPWRARKPLRCGFGGLRSVASGIIRLANSARYGAVVNEVLLGRTGIEATCLLNGVAPQGNGIPWQLQVCDLRVRRILMAERRRLRVVVAQSAPLGAPWPTHFFARHLRIALPCGMQRLS